MTRPEPPFTDAELTLIAEALDSHRYWQLAPAERRRDGFVTEPLTDEERETERLEDKVRAMVRGEEVSQ